ncbi:MAG: NADH:ubiquinone reductase (Na(+)-transporting) subunit A, partial [Myxococcota bacterium]|nr:NADH:ubiquinone reductase (Na(+)-transporting) subunit A [Myxococcota bacterium]
MAEHVIGKGLNIPINGAPEQTVGTGAPVTRVAVLGDDYPTMKPRMHVAVGDVVKRGQLLFEDRKSEGVRFTAPGAGEVTAINRGDKRRFVSLVITLNEAERSGEPGEDAQVAFEAYAGKPVPDVSGDEARALLAESGLWTAFRTRPYGRVPATGDTCQGIFVTAIDTNPLAPSLDAVLAGKDEELKAGLQVLRKLTDGAVRLCVAAGSTVNAQGAEGVDLESCSGPQPAGLVGPQNPRLEGVNRA